LWSILYVQYECTYNVRIVAVGFRSDLASRENNSNCSRRRSGRLNHTRGVAFRRSSSFMTRASRRKTLSHSDIENFLSDIDVAADMPLPPVTVETVQTDINAQFCVPLSPPPIAMGTRVVDPMRSEVQHIRDFCKVCSFVQSVTR
jgi:hypothetical protein